MLLVTGVGTRVFVGEGLSVGVSLGGGVLVGREVIVSAMLVAATTWAEAAISAGLTCPSVQAERSELISSEVKKKKNRGIFLR